MSAIFISHSSRDDAAAAELRSRLADQGHHSVFLDFDPAIGIPAGHSWEQELYARLRASRAVIVLCSPSSMASDWVFAEITHARALGKPVFPIRIAPCEVRSLLSDVQIIDLTADREAGYARLWRGLEVAGLDPRNVFLWDGARPPYPGLLAFQEEDAAVFFGRDDEVRDGLGLLRRLQRFGGARALLVLGASGSGKSSVVRAGLVPRLRRDPDAWQVVGPLRPLGRPFAQLAAAFAAAFERATVQRETVQRETVQRETVQRETVQRETVQRETVARDAAALAEAFSPGGGKARAAALVEAAAELRQAAGRADATVLLVVDQFEELLAEGRETRLPGEVAAGEEARRFLPFLRSALAAEGSPLMVAATLRSDFLGDFQGHPALRDLGFESLAIGPLPVEGYAQVIEGPATLAGIELEPGLVQAMVRDTEADDALPLLAFTLREMWERFRDDGRFEVAEYRERLGGLHGSVALVAEAVLRSRPLAEAERADLRAAFVALVRLNDEGQYARRTTPWRRLPASVHDVLQRFVEARLLVARGEGGERQLEVAHEALLRSWEPLVAWLEEDRAFLLWRKRLDDARREWQRTEQDPGALLTGPALGEAVGWLRSRREALSHDEQLFIDRSLAAYRRRRRLWNLLSAAVATVMAGLALSAHFARLRVEKARVLGHDQNLFSHARIARTFDPRLSAQKLLDLYHPELYVDTLDLEAVIAAGELVAVSPDEMFVVRRTTGGVAVQAAADDRWRVELPHPAPVYAAALDGYPEMFHNTETRSRRVLTAAADGTVRLWALPAVPAPVIDLLDARPPQLVTGPRTSLNAELLVAYEGHRDRISALAFSDDSRYAYTLCRDEVAVWEVASQTPPPLLRGHRGDVTAATFCADSSCLVTTSEDGEAFVWSLADLLAAPVRFTDHQTGIVAAAIRDDDEEVLTAARDGEVRRWSIRSGRSEVLATADCPVLGVAYTMDPAQVLIGCADGTARLLNTRHGSVLRRLQ